MPDWLTAELATVPDFQTFLDADEHESRLAEIAARYPEVATLEQVGTSRLGDAIHALRVGDAADHAIVFGLPHPNEPIGGLSALHLAERLCADSDLRSRIGLTFTIIPCIDPDGLRLNHGWVKGPYTRDHYARHFYRPPGHEQIEWTFPLHYKNASFDKVLPETRALMRLIDEVQPVFMASLHNAEMGGAYYYLSRPVPELYEVLQQIPQGLGVPLHRGEPEHPSIPILADGIHHGLSAKDTYDYLESEGLDPTVIAVAGDTSGSYAEKYGTVTLISEVPYWSDPRCDDTTELDSSYRDLLAETDPRRTHSLVEAATQTIRLYAPDDALDDLDTQVFETCADGWVGANDPQRRVALALGAAATAVTVQHHAQVEGLLGGTGVGDTVRWAVLERRCALGAAGDAEIDALLGGSPSSVAGAAGAALRARAAQPTPESKRRGLDALLAGEVSGLPTFGAALWHRRHGELLGEYAESYLQRLPECGSALGQGIAARLAKFTFPVAGVDDAWLDRAAALASSGELPDVVAKGLRHRADRVRRGLAVRRQPMSPRREPLSAAAVTAQQ